MSGIIGMVADSDVAYDLGCGTTAQNYLGDDKCDMTVLSGGKLKTVSGSGPALSVFGSLDLSKYSGKIGIAHNSYRLDSEQPFRLKINGLEIAVCIDADKKVMDEIVTAIVACKNLRDGVRNSLRKIKDPFSLVAISNKEELIAARNNGRKPLEGS